MINPSNEQSRSGAADDSELYLKATQIHRFTDSVHALVTQNILLIQRLTANTVCLNF
jgi:hypothetical protein